MRRVRVFDPRIEVTMFLIVSILLPRLCRGRVDWEVCLPLSSPTFDLPSLFSVGSLSASWAAQLQSLRLSGIIC